MDEECRMDDVIVRLKKVNGQIQGLIRMIESKEECEKVVTQFQAAKAALDNTYSLVLNRNLLNCLNRQDSGSVEKIVKLISKQ
jgi:DNA-binding FrmR family transcriptional regulator